MGLVDKKSINIPRIASYEWSPSKHHIAVFVAEDKNNNAYISVIELPGKTEIYRKALFNVITVRSISFFFSFSIYQLFVSSAL